MDETVFTRESAEDAVTRLAGSKVEKAVSEAAFSALVIGADTLIARSGWILGKPANEEEALEMLALLSGGMHYVHTAVVLACGQRRLRALSSSRVWMRATCAEERCAYVSTGEPLGKAGAYAIQGLGAIFISRLEGSYSGIMGLPLFEITQLLKSCGMNIP